MIRIVSFLLPLAVAALAADGASITGTVRGTDGSLIAEGQVTASPRSSAAVHHGGVRPPVAVLFSNGSFQLSGLDYGAYQVCVTVPGTVWLDSCEWGETGAAAALTPSQPAASLTITLEKGAAVPVRVNDPSQFLPALEGISAGAHLLIGVGGESLAFHPATIVSQDSSGRNYRFRSAAPSSFRSPARNSSSPTNRGRRFRSLET